MAPEALIKNPPMNPLPWYKTIRQNAISILGASHIALAVDLHMKDAEYIIEACNNYPETLNQIQKLKEKIEDLQNEINHLSWKLDDQERFMPEWTW